MASTLTTARTYMLGLGLFCSLRAKGRTGLLQWHMADKIQDK